MNGNSGIPSSSSPTNTTPIKRTTSQPRLASGVDAQFAMTSNGNTTINSSLGNNIASTGGAGTGGLMTSSSTSTMSSSSPFSNAAGNAPRDSGDHGESQYGGHSMQGISGPTKGDYRLVGLADEDHAKGRQSNKGLPGAGLLTVPEQPQNPAFAIGSYCVASIVMTVVNKFVLSGRHFTMNFLLLAIQSIVCVGCVVISKRMKAITYRDFDKEDARKWFPISFLLVVVIYTGSKALQYLTIPVYTIFKNLTIILIAYGEVLWFNGQVTGMSLISFGLMVLSSLIAAWDDISRVLAASSGAAFKSVVSNASDSHILAGYVWMAINCLASAGYVLGMRKRIKVTNFSDWDSMYYNNLLSIPVLVIFSLLFERWSAETLALNFPPESRNFLIFAMIVSGAIAVGISYSTAWCVRVTSSTTYSMVGALNKLPVAASGLIFFGDPVTFGSVSAILVGFIAGLVYTVAKKAAAAAKKVSGMEMSGKPR